MKHILPFFILFFIGVNIHGQDVIMTNTDTILTTAAVDNQDVVAHTFAQNATRTVMNMRWELTNFSDQPSGWTTAICDNITCYPDFVLTNVVEGGVPDEPVVLNPGDSSIIDMHLYPDGNPGCGHTQVCFSTKEDPNTILGCMTYKFKVGTTNCGVVSTETTQLGAMEVFPNPTTEYFGLTNNGSIKEIQVYNMLGRKQRVFDAAIGRKYYVGDMPAGMYLVAFIDKEGNIAKTTRLVKRFYRP